MIRSSNNATSALPDFTEEAFCTWLGSAAPGDTIVYHRGFLAFDGGPATDATAATRTRLLRLASRAMRLSQQGLVHLVQRREADREFTYIAVARPRPLSNVGGLKTVMTAAYPDSDDNTADVGERGRVRRSA